MLFSSTTFILYFLPVCIIVYYGILKKFRTAQNVFLTFASLFFYAWGEPKFVLIMLLSIIMNWAFGLLVNKYKGKNKITTRLVIAATIVFNLSILFVFKYLTFTGNIFVNLFNLSVDVPKITLPIGISFFTFQAMSYVLDVYRDNGEAQKNPLNVGLYIAFFPQLIAGPIVRYETVAHEIKHRKETVDDFFDGFTRFIIGMAKKVLLANSFSVFADAAFNNIDGLSVAGSWFGAICYTFQIFFDFGGYSDMAIGLGKMFGFHFLENFNYPYISLSISEFWRRWHISLGTWFRDYLYFPLGGSRVKKPRLIFNLFVVWFATGVWHGANWTFIIWGLMYFVLLVAEKLTGLDKRKSKPLGNVFRWIYTMLFVVLGWVIFRADSLTDAWQYIGVMFGVNSNGLGDAVVLRDIVNTWIYLLFAILFSTPIVLKIKEKWNLEKPVFQIFKCVAVVLLFVLSFASVTSSSHNPFIYFNF
ncbi:MAG: MBOAT family protein [Ruminococcaceae bacterium]|nr:MBOAT family protein [Oscillospiraceae bacterium]